MAEYENGKIMEIKDLCMYFPAESDFFGKTTKELKAVDGVSFSMYAGKTFGLVGESGCGKTTVGKCILRAYKPTAGQILYKGTDLAPLSEEAMKPYRRKIQLIFQDPYGSLDPRQNMAAIIRESLRQRKGRQTRAEEDGQIDELLTTVELDPSMKDRYAHEMSGGQRQRLGIARALACSPEIIVCDEPVSALDVSIQAQIINLFSRLQKERGLTYLFIAHDLAVVKHIADTIAVMYLGHIVEIVQAEELYRNPLHPYTKALMSAVPTTDYYVEKKRSRIYLEGEIPSPLHMPPGCPFSPRCPYAKERCREELPALREVETGHCVACHIV